MRAHLHQTSRAQATDWPPSHSHQATAAVAASNQRVVPLSPWLASWPGKSCETGPHVRSRHTCTTGDTSSRALARGFEYSPSLSPSLFRLVREHDCQADSGSGTRFASELGAQIRKQTSAVRARRGRGKTRCSASGMGAEEEEEEGGGKKECFILF